MIKKLFIALLAMVSIPAFAEKEWIDVTDYYLTNPYYKDGSTEGWSGDTPSGRTDGALSFSPWGDYYYYLYQDVDLSKGKYRVTLQGFYRRGTAAQDYALFKANNTSSDLCYLYILSNDLYIEQKMASASSAAQKTPLGGKTSMVGDSLYIPADVTAAKAWFDAGYYNNTVTFQTNGSSVSFYMWNSTVLSNQLICMGKWKIEVWAEKKLVTEIVPKSKTVEMVPSETINQSFDFVPSDATIQLFDYKSSNPEVAVVDKYGNVTAKKAGTATITITARDEGHASATYNVVVNNPEPATAENVIINEIMVSNLEMVMDNSYNYGPWIELYNPSNQKVDISDIYVTDDLKDLKKAKVILDKTYIPNHGYRCVYFDHYDGVFSKNQIDFKLKYEGDTIYVTDGEKVLASQAYPQGRARMSYARTTDGGDTWSWTDIPTAGFPNRYGIFAEEQVAEPVIAEKGGYFKDDVEVHVTCPEGAYLTFTTDGTLPDRLSKVISQDTVFVASKASLALRVRAYKEGYLPSNVVTRTFIYKDKNYVFPALSLTTNESHINGMEYGILTGSGYGFGRPGNGKDYNCNWNADWDRPVNMEYFDGNEEYSINQEVDISACGGWSRAYSPHSFKLKASKYYLGQNSMDYPFFADKPSIKHKALQIRNGGNDTAARFKDAGIQQIVRSSGIKINTQSWQPVHVFLNGQYSSVLNMREPNNKHFAYSNYGYDTDSIDQFEMSPDSGYVQKEGDIEKFLEWYDLSADAANPETYDKICDIVEMDEFINYMALELYIGNWDWPQNNVKAFRHRNGGKFHFVVFDTEQFNGVSGSPFAAFKNKKEYTFDYLRGNDLTPWYTGQRIKQEIKLVTIFLNMLKNETFRKQFVDTYAIMNGSVFEPTRVNSVISEAAKYMNSGLAFDKQSCTTSANSITSFFNTSGQTTKMNYLKSFDEMGLSKTSSCYLALSSNIPEAEIYLNNLKVPTGAMSGYAYQPIKIRANAPAGYRFEGWSKFATTAIISTDIELDLTNTKSARYYAHWTKMTDEEMIAEGLNPSPVVINEVSASNDIYVNDYYKKADWIELYNNSDAEVNIAGMYISDNTSKPTKCQIPEDNPTLNTIIPAHGYKVIWCDKKDNKTSAIHASFKLEADSGTVMISKYNGSDIVYADTLAYEGHGGTESYGRYPDAGSINYLMIKPTPGASNVCYADIASRFADFNVITGIEDVKISDDGNGMIIAYVGNGIVNVKSSDSTISAVRVYSTSGALVMAENVKDSFVTVNLSNLNNGTYVIKAVDSLGNSTQMKINK